MPSDGCFALAAGWIVSNSDAIGYYIAEEFPVVAEPTLTAGEMDFI